MAETPPREGDDKDDPRQGLPLTAEWEPRWLYLIPVVVSAVVFIVVFVLVRR